MVIGREGGNSRVGRDCCLIYYMELKEVFTITLFLDYY